MEANHLIVQAHHPDTRLTFSSTFLLHLTCPFKNLKKYKKEGKANYFKIKHKTEIALCLVHKTELTILRSLPYFLPQTFLGNQLRRGIIFHLCGRHHGCSARVTGSERQLWFGRTDIPNKAARAFTASGYLASFTVPYAPDGEGRKGRCTLGPSSQAMPPLSQ